MQDSSASSPRKTSKTELEYDGKKIRSTCQIINRYLQAVDGIYWEGQGESLFQQVAPSVGDTPQNTALQGISTNSVTLVIPPSTTEAQALLENITSFSSLPPQNSTSIPMGATTYPFATSFPFIVDHTFPSIPNPLPTFPPFSVSMPQPPFYTSGPRASTTIHTHVDPFYDL
ncbi:hypothetical protein E3N88_34818 [Mikania micrantha]|uniref:Uncharacterized protein n=1 Tax=Mikania micrantha TaxID=192012 RepID=A0A5N6LZD2_9ASTR|nr:hypothetical protein E3N88_34818 [Mikania micrantha]